MSVNLFLNYSMETLDHKKKTRWTQRKGFYQCSSNKVNWFWHWPDFYLSMCGVLVCPPGKYKAVTGDEHCQPCPAHSKASDYGLAECRCNSGFYRSPKDLKSTPCTRKYLFNTLLSMPINSGRYRRCLDFDKLHQVIVLDKCHFKSQRIFCNLQFLPKQLKSHRVRWATAARSFCLPYRNLSWKSIQFAMGPTSSTLNETTCFFPWLFSRQNYLAF